MSSNSETYATRLRQYERREQMTIWVAAGIGTLLALVSVDALKKAPEIFGPLLLTIGILGGLCLAFARVKFEWLATEMRRGIEDGTVKNSDPLSASDEPWPNGADTFWRLSLLAILVGWILFLIGIWWSPVQMLWQNKKLESTTFTHSSVISHVKTVHLDINGISSSSQVILTSETDVVPNRIVISTSP